MVKTVGDLMTDEVYSCMEKDDLMTAYDLMDSAGVRHLPVVGEDGVLVGLISQRDLMRTGIFEAELTPDARRDALQSRKVREILIREPATTTEDQDIDEAADLLLENKFGCLPVVEGTRLVGILTESDFVRCVRDAVRALRKPRSAA